MSGDLKLKAIDAEDVEALAVLLQDALAPVCDMLFDAEARNFVMVLHRFRHAEGSAFERVCCALDIAGVEKVERQGIRKDDPDQILDLLTIEFKDGLLTFLFAGEASLRLKLANGLVLMRDFGDPWPVSCCPDHKI